MSTEQVLFVACNSFNNLSSLIICQALPNETTLPFGAFLPIVETSMQNMVFSRPFFEQAKAFLDLGQQNHA